MFSSHFVNKVTQLTRHCCNQSLSALPGFCYYRWSRCFHGWRF